MRLGSGGVVGAREVDCVVDLCCGVDVLTVDVLVVGDVVTSVVRRVTLGVEGVVGS